MAAYLKMTHVTCRLTAKNKNSRTLRSVIEYGLPLPFTICFGQSCRGEVVGAKNEILKPNFRLQMPFKGVSLAFTKFSGLVETFTLGQLLILELWGIKWRDPVTPKFTAPL